MVLILHLGLILMSPSTAGLRAGTAVIDVGSRKQFFVDERFIESSRGVRLTMNPPLNLDTGGGGQARVEILDESGRAVPGFSRDEALPTNGNSVRLRVRWRADPALEKLAGRPFRLRFQLQDCKLYAFQFKESDGAVRGMVRAPDFR